MSCGIEWESKRPPIAGGLRKKLDIRELSDPNVAVNMIKESFKQRGWSQSGITVQSYTALQLAPVELITMRLYTGA